jgi:zinc transport system permease protein
MIELFEYAFMKNALLAGVSLGMLLAYIGVFIVLKKMSFFGDGIAHASLAGVAAAILMNANPIIGGVIAAIVFAIAIFFIEDRSEASGDAAIGMIFSFGMALGILLMGFAPGYKTELISFLFGNILAISSAEAVISLFVAVIFTIVIFLIRKQLGLMALSDDLAAAEGIKTRPIKLLFYVMTAVSVVLGIKVLGIVLVSAAMIIPASCAKLTARSFAMTGLLAVIFSEVFVIGGIVSSYSLNIPTGSAIVLIGAASFMILRGIYFIARPSTKGRGKASKK